MNWKAWARAAADSLTFECDTVPTDAVTVNVLVLS